MNAVLDYDPATSLRHWPMPMARFGLNPYSENLYRIVFAPSRRFLVCGTWPDGSNKARYQRKYPQVGEQWIMERWLPAEQFAKCSQTVWDRDMSILGPWPERGEYEVCHVFEACTPDNASIEKLIAWVELGRSTSFFETQTWHREDAAREKKATSDLMEDMIRNRLSAFISAPMSSARVSRGTKSAPIVRTAAELGLPTRGGQLRSRTPANSPRSPKFEVPLTV